MVLHGHPHGELATAGQVAPLESGNSGGSSEPASVSVDVTGGAGAGGAGTLPRPLSDTQILQELKASGISPNPDVASLTPGGLATTPANAPPAIAAAINAGNEIAHLPYVWGGGHAVYIDNGYDCSGSLSFILAAAGLLQGTETSGELESYGAPGPGKWITIFANAGHTFAYIAGLRFDTVALAETGTRWSNRSADEPDLHSFVIRHPIGY